MDVNKAERLYEKYAKAMLRAAGQMTQDYQLAQDAVHQAIEKAMKMLDKIDESNPARAGGLLCMMAQQAATELYKKKTMAVGEQIIDDENYADVAVTDDLLEQLLRKEAVNNMREALKWLPNTYLDPVIMKYGCEWTNEEIARTLGIEVNNVYIRLFRAKERIKKYLTEGGRLS